MATDKELAASLAEMALSMRDTMEQAAVTHVLERVEQPLDIVTVQRYEAMPLEGLCGSRHDDATTTTTHSYHYAEFGNMFERDDGGDSRYITYIVRFYNEHVAEVSEGDCYDNLTNIIHNHVPNGYYLCNWPEPTGRFISEEIAVRERYATYDHVLHGTCSGENGVHICAGGH